MHRSLRRTASVALPLTLALTAIVVLPASPAAAASCTAGTASDFNGDGHADVAVAEPSGADRVHVIYGTAHGLTANASGTAPNDQLLADPNGLPNGFGEALATGDFNGDGCADLAVGDPIVSLTGAFDAGVVDVYFGSPSGLTFGHELTAKTIGLSLVADANFGSALATGDFNGDKLADLLIGAPNQADGLPTSCDGGGAIYIVPGSKSKTFTGGKLFAQGDGKVPGTPEPDDHFGSALATGDFNGDHLSDVAVGADGENTSSGVVDVLRGSGSAAMLTATGAQAWTQNTSGVPGTAEPGDGLGAALAAGDFTGDGKDDLAISVPFESDGSVAEAGTVDVLYGSSGGLSASHAQAWTQDDTGVPGAVATENEFGFALAAGDFNGGGKVDLAVGSPGESVGSAAGAGVVDTLIGASGGLTATGSTAWDQGTTGISGTPEHNDGFGTVLYAARIRSGSRADLVVGVPFEGDGSISFAGAMHVIPGSSSGLTATGSQLFEDSTTGIQGATCQGCEFGHTIA
ncbi:MAG TPA: FG-GAP-like repeat-containing protein [Micromonosporaceae bacterium]